MRATEKNNSEWGVALFSCCLWLQRLNLGVQNLRHELFLHNH